MNDEKETWRCKLKVIRQHINTKREPRLVYGPECLKMRQTHLQDNLSQKHVTPVKNLVKWRTCRNHNPSLWMLLFCLFSLSQASERQKKAQRHSRGATEFSYNYPVSFILHFLQATYVVMINTTVRTLKDFRRKPKSCLLLYIAIITKLKFKDYYSADMTDILHDSFKTFWHKTSCKYLRIVKSKQHL